MPHQHSKPYWSIKSESTNQINPNWIRTNGKSDQSEHVKEAESDEIFKDHFAENDNVIGDGFEAAGEEENVHVAEYGGARNGIRF